MPDDQHEVRFIPSGRGKATQPADPRYPKGKEILPDLPADIPTCRVELPYPAPECGLYSIQCRLCQVRVAVTAAGRPDDPTAVTFPCAVHRMQEGLLH